MSKPIPASLYISIGECIFHLKNPQVANAESYARDAGRFLRYIQDAGFTGTDGAARGIAQMTMGTNRVGGIAPVSALQLQAMMNAAYNVLFDEADRTITIALNTSDVSQKLRSLGDRIKLNDVQRHLQGETIRCIECEAYRAGAVMGWGLAYDWIRRWIWDEVGRRSAFNAEIMKKKRGGDLLYPGGLTSYDDFYSIRPALGERDCIATMKEAGLLTGVFERLASLLAERNRYAHANTLIPSRDQTNRYIDELIDLICNAPFV